MHETKKLKEAKHFYSRMVEEQKDRDHFMYELSAFLSAGRTVLQYARDEAKTKADGQKWYDSLVSHSPVLKFFKEKRDVNIHIEPVNTQAEHRLAMGGSIFPSGLLSMVAFDKDGNVIDQRRSEEPEKSHQEEVKDSPTVYELKYRFDDWTGNEDVLTLCQTYIQELEILIKDGVSKGFITG
jgi:hypothetical protein